MKLIDKIKGGGYGNNGSVDDGVPTYTVTMLGGSGSGKTVYMHALFQFLKHGNVAGHNIMAHAQNVQEQLARDAEIEKFTWTHIMRQNQGKLILPEGTSETQEWSFSLTHREKRICNFNWIDYRGGLSEIESLQSEDQEAVFLRELIARSDGLILFINSTSLFYFEDDEDKKHWSGINALNQILRSFAVQMKNAPYSTFSEEKPNKKGVSVVLAKSDSDLLDTSLAKPALLNENRNVSKPYAGLIKAYMQHATSLNEVLVDSSSGATSWQAAITPVGAFGHGRTETTLKATSPDGSVDDCVYDGEDKGAIPSGNKLKKYFDSFSPPAQEVEYKMIDRSNRFPNPVNAFSPVLWVLDNLLKNSNAKGLTGGGGLFKGMLNSFRSQLFENDKAAEIEDPTTTNVVKQSIIVPLDSIYKH